MVSVLSLIWTVEVFKKKDKETLRRKDGKGGRGRGSLVTRRTVISNQP